jgi:hypothetical protein
VEAYGKREKLPAEAVAAEAVELVRVAEDQEAPAERVVAAKAPAVLGVVEAGAERAAVAEERAQAARVDLEAEAPGAELAGVEWEAPAGLEVDPAAAGEGVEALAVDLAAEAPALLAARVDLVVDLGAPEVQVVRVAAVRLAAEARLPSLANG